MVKKRPLERDYQPKVLERLRKTFPGCYLLKNDSGYLQGVPDWIILYGDRWAMLEIKRSRDSKAQPNQPWYVERLNELSFAAFIYPDNEEVVIRELQAALEPCRSARIPERKSERVVEL